MLRLVTVFYGNSPLYRLEVLGSVLSAFSLASDKEHDIEVHVFTDQDMSNFPFPVITHGIENAQKRSELGGTSVPHLVKDYCLIEILEDGDGPILYFDIDIFFNVTPKELFKHIGPVDVLMNADEGVLNDYREWDVLVGYIEKVLQFEGGLDRHSPMYNSGIVGLLPEHKDALLKSIELTHELYPIDPVFNIQQFSTGVMLEKMARVHTCEQEIFHYWGWKRKFIHIELERFSLRHERSTGDEMIAAYRQSPIKRDPDIHFLDRITAGCKAKLHAWTSDYSFAYLCYLSSQRVAKYDTEIANAWIMSCIEALKWALQRGDQQHLTRIIKRDYSRLFAGRSTEWFSEDVTAEVELLLVPVPNHTS